MVHHDRKVSLHHLSISHLDKLQISKTRVLASFMFRSTHFFRCEQVSAVRYRGEKKTSFSQKFSA